MLFSTSPATGLCLYNRRRMPLHIVNGALLTHPVVEVSGRFSRNGMYDSAVTRLSDVDPLSHVPRRQRTHSASTRSIGRRNDQT